MAEECLKRCLSGDINAEELYAWILHKKYSNVFGNSSPGEFISLFLNFIHESTISANIDPNTPQKIEHHTPKSIRPPCNEAAKPRRRSALFSNQVKQSDDNNDALVGIAHVISNDKSPVNIERPMTSTNAAHAQSDFNLLSPLHNVNTPIRWRNKPLQQSTPVQNKGLCLADFISSPGVAKKSSAKKRGQKNYNECNQNRQHKRINPVLHTGNTNTGNSNSNGNSFNFQNIDKNAEIFKAAVYSNTNLATVSTPSNSCDINVTKDTPIKLSEKTEIEPNLSLTTFVEYLDNCSNIYLFLLKNNLTLNILSEFSFLTTLLLSRRYSSDDFPKNEDNKILNLKDIFGSIHNIVYFASKVLKEFIDFFRIFDRPTLKFLLDNGRVTEFVNILKELEFLYNAKHQPLLHPVSIKPQHNSTPSPYPTQSTVHFAADTDGRPNFNSDAAFNAFRRQRDVFYDILRIWQQNQQFNVHDNTHDSIYIGTTRDFNMVVRVKQLLGMNVEGDGDYRHLARLWRGQMLVDCSDQQSPITTSSDSHLITVLPQLHPDKLTLLRSRLTTRQQPSSFNALPTTSGCLLPPFITASFPGMQEFYRDFIIASDGHSWSCHLRNALLCELVRVYEETVKICADYQENQRSTSGVDGNGEVIVGRLGKLKLLAKFLCFLESIPYYNTNILHLNKDLQSKYLSVMESNDMDGFGQHYRPTLDVLDYLEQAVRGEKLVLTIPWVVEYCSMLDTSVMRVTYFKNVFKIFFQIYHESKYDFKNNSKNLILLCLGWLFELPHFPSELFYTWYNNRTTNLVKTNNILKGSKQSVLSIDQLNIIDETILYSACPYLGEYRRLLLSNHTCKNNVTIKHITPVPAIEQKSPEVTERKLKAQLEDSFFNGQPASVRKIVDFVSERVASTCVKIICNKIVPIYRKSSLASFKHFLEGQTFDETNIERLKFKIEAESKEFQARSLKYLQILCASDVKQVIQDRVYVSVELLLSEEELPQTKVTCGEIAARISYEKVQNWISIHVNTGVLSKEFHVEIEKYINKCKGALPTTAEFKLTFQLPSEGKCMDHNDEVLNAVSIVEAIREITLIALESPYMISIDAIDKIIQDACDTLSQRCDVNDCILFLINKLLLDFLITLVGHKFDVVTTTLIQKFIAFWSRYCVIEKPNLNSTKDTLNLSKCQMDVSLNPVLDHLNSFSLMECQNNESEINITSNELTNFNLYIIKRLFNVIICPRNIIILSYGGNDNSYRVFAMLIVELLQRDLISGKDIEEQVVSLYKHEWDEMNLQRISIFILELIDSCKNLETDSRFSLLLMFLCDFCELHVA